MKNNLLIIIFLIVAVNSTAQIIDRISFNYGLTNSDLEWDFKQDDPTLTLIDIDNRRVRGFYSGIDFEYLGSKFFTLMTGVGFYQKGAKYDWGNRETKMSFDYLTFDTKLKIKYDIKNLTPYLIVGPRIDYLIRFNSYFEEYDRLKMMNKTNYGLRYGFGLQYSFERFIMGFAWKNNASFNSIIENDGEYMRPAFDINDKTMIFNLDFGIKL